MTTTPVPAFAMSLWNRRQLAITVLSALGIALHVTLRWILRAPPGWSTAPLVVVLAVGGLPLLIGLGQSVKRRELGTDLLAGLAIVTAAALGEYLAGAIIVLMLSGGQALEAYVVQRASSVLGALAKRMPSIAHRRTAGRLEDVALQQVSVGDVLVIFPHESCPVDGTVIDGHGVMDESFLTGEPFHMSKAPGAGVISGAVNGQTALTITVTKRAEDSRYAKIMEVMREAEHHRPEVRRLGDRLAALYVPVAVSIALAAWWLSGTSERFLAVLVIATPCPLLIGIPVAILGAISACARRAIVVKRPVVLEQLRQCRVGIFDKTGTLTYGVPHLSEISSAVGVQRRELLGLMASLEQYSKHPLAQAVLAEAQHEGVPLEDAAQISEQPGKGLRGMVHGREVWITNRKSLTADRLAQMPSASAAGLECVVLLDGAYAATCRFRDQPRADGRAFVQHLGPRHGLRRVLIVSGDRASEVRCLAEQVGITEVFAEQTPEEKLAIVRRETAQAKTLYVGDGINDAPALMAATVGMAIGGRNDVTTEAADIVIMDSTLVRVDEVLHIGERMVRIALQSAIGGMVLSAVGMGVAAAGYLTPSVGAVLQEVIDLLAVLNALRAAKPPRELSDY